MLVLGTVMVAATVLSLAALGRSRPMTALSLGVLVASPWLLGDVFPERFDVWPAALTAVAVVLALRSRHASAACVLAVAAAAKLYALLLLPVVLVMVVRQRGARAALTAAAAVGSNASPRRVAAATQRDAAPRQSSDGGHDRRVVAARPQPGGRSAAADVPGGHGLSVPRLRRRGRERQTETIFSNGDVQFTGFFLTRLTNAAKPDTSLELVSGGPVRLSFGEITFHITTRGPIIFFFFFFPGDAGPGDASTGRTHFFHGHTEVEVDQKTGLFLSFESRGKADDLCAALA